MCFICSHVVVVFSISSCGFRLLVSVPSLPPEELLLAFLVGQLWTLIFCISGNVLVSSFLKDNFCWIEDYSSTALIFFLISALCVGYPIALGVSMVFDEILAFSLLEDSLYMMNCFTFAAFRIPSGFFPSLIMVSLGEWFYLLQLLWLLTRLI